MKEGVPGRVMQGHGSFHAVEATGRKGGNGGTDFELRRGKHFGEDDITAIAAWRERPAELEQAATPGAAAIIIRAIGRRSYTAPHALADSCASIFFADRQRL
jgi:hypothetical protein